MSKIKALNFIILLWLGLINFSYAKPSSNEQPLTKILGNTTSLQAKFEHKIFNKTGNLIQLSHGVVALQRPNKFLWQTNHPSKDLVIIDGKNMWHYDEELQQASVQVFDENQQLFPMELLLAGNISDIENVFYVKAASLAKCAKASQQCFNLKPKKTYDTVRQIILGLNNGAIYYLKLWDQLGQQSEFKFLEVVKNPTLSADNFKFILPPGIDLIGR